MSRTETGYRNFHAGASAETRIEVEYQNRGCAVVARRWRGAAGEIDLIMRDKGCFVFVEVKQSRSFARAAQNLNARQMDRIYRAAGEFLGSQPGGLDSEARFDVALLDSIGAFEIIENAFGQF